MGYQGLRDYPLFYTGGEIVQLNVAGDFFRIIEATGPLFVSIDNGPFVKREVGQAQRERFSSLRIRSDVAQSARVTAGYGELSDSRQAVTVNVVSNLDPGNTLANPGDVTVPAGGTTLILAGNASRRRAIVQSSFSNDPAIIARIGGATVGAASGVELTAGAGLPPLETTAALYCHNPGASAIKILVLEDYEV